MQIHCYEGHNSIVLALMHTCVTCQWIIDQCADLLIWSENLGKELGLTLLIFIPHT